MAVESFLDDLTNWHIRRSRRRFWKSEHDQDKRVAYATLYYVLVRLVRLLAPFTPFVTEVMYQNLVRAVQAAGLRERAPHRLAPGETPPRSTRACWKGWRWRGQSPAWA